MIPPGPSSSPHRRRQVTAAMNETLPPWNVLVLESHHSSEFTMQPRTHSFLKVIYILAGAGDLHLEDRQFRFAADDCLVVPPGVSNWISDGDSTPVSLYAGCIGASVLRCDPTLGEGLSVCHQTGPDRVTLSIAATLRRMVYCQDAQAETCGVEMLVDAWKLIRLVLGLSMSSRGSTVATRSHREPDADRDAVRAYVDELSTTFLEATTIDAAAASVQLSRRTFTEMFRNETGTTWLKHVGSLRIRHAAKLLATTDLPIASVAFESGFADLSTFYRRFSSSLHCSPAVYRQQIQAAAQ